MFLSDNTAPASPEVLDYIQRALQNATDTPYGDDRQTAQLDAILGEIFATEVKVLPVLSGTAANCLALSAMCPSVGAIVAHRDSHLCLSENTAPHFFTGGAAVHRIGDGPDLIQPDELTHYCENTPWRDVHSAVPRALALAQASELGRVYSAEHMAELSAICRHYGLALYVDGARFANAVIASNCQPADLSWRVGVDALTFGAIKNGTFGAEALVLFKPELFAAVRQKAKQAGHLASKMRYLSAQLIAYFDQDLWRRNAEQANQAAHRLAEVLQAHPCCELAIEAQTNQLFVTMPEALQAHLATEGFDLYPWKVNEQSAYRLVSHWATSDADIEAFTSALNRYQSDS